MGVLLVNAFDSTQEKHNEDQHSATRHSYEEAIIVICPNRKKRYATVCRNCGYDPKTGVAKLSREDLGLVDPKGPQADIWIGYFPDEETFHQYFAESDEYEEDAPISRFADEQGIGSYDHDFFVIWFGIAAIESACREVFSENTDLSEIRAAIDRSPRTPFNAVAMQVDELGDEEQPRSVEGQGYWLHYLGRFEYEPRD